ncbi:MAG: GNAT family N-acetyltransferase [Burkholderiaceae bacterium]|nr:GNAT family N-acetyltransferase [Burkholderiaceae bacterium]
MSDAYEFRPYEPSDREQVIALQQHLWGADAQRNAAYFAWKYEENPYAKDIAIHLALHDGEVVAMRGMMGAIWHPGAERPPLPVLCACDLVSSPEHRGRNLVRPLMNCAIDDLRRRGHDRLFSFSASPFTFLSSIRSGWRLVAPYRPLRWQTRRSANAARMRARMAGRPLLWRYADRRIPLLDRDPAHCFSRLESRLSQRGAHTGIDIEVERTPRPEVMAAIARRNAGGHDRVRHLRDESYARWRYRNPQSDYCFVFAGAGTPAGYMVLRTARAGRAADAAIVDWEADEPGVLRKMLEAVQRSGAFDSITLWSATLAPAMIAMMAGLGFGEIDATRNIKGFTPGLLVRTLRDAGDDPLEAALAQACGDAGRWDLRMIYSDQY